MAKCLPVLCIAILAPSISKARVVKSFGLKAGAVVAEQSWDYFAGPLSGFDPGYSNRWGFDIGSYVEWFNVPYLSLLTEVHYVQKGMSYKVVEVTYNQPTGTGRYITFRPRVDYVSVPVLVKIQLRVSRFEPYFLLGPRFDFLVNRNDEATGLVYDDFNESDIGGTFGVGFELLRLLPVGLLTEFRFSPSFNRSFRGEFLEVKNKSFELLLGVKL